jgi:Na+-translocating ferredoxin:NAD+ oxidoreductase RNF subunit RnfB
MCRHHYAQKQLDLSDDDIVSRILENADRFVSSQRGNSFLQAAAGIFSELMSPPVSQEARVLPKGPPIGRCRTCGHIGLQGHPCAVCIERARAQESSPPNADDPRAVLGFKQDQTLTRQEIKTRQRQLAVIMHPDSGGSDAGMQRINEAAAALLAELP